MSKFLESQDTNLIISILEKRLPHSAHVFNMVLVKRKGKLDIKIFSLCLTSDSKDTWIVVLHFKKDLGKDICISIPPDGALNVSQEIKVALKNKDFMDWNDKYSFVAIERPLSYLLIQIGLENGNVLEIHPCSFFVNKEQKHSPVSCPENTEIRRLTAKDSEIIVKNWKYRNDSTLDYINDVIDLPSAGLLYNGELVSYIITSAYGIASYLHTVDEHRRKGYGKLVMLQMQNEMKYQGFFPVSSVETQNHGSVDLHLKSNLQFLYDTDYILHLKQ